MKFSRKMLDHEFNEWHNKSFVVIIIVFAIVHIFFLYFSHCALGPWPLQFKINFWNCESYTKLERVVGSIPRLLSTHDNLNTSKTNIIHTHVPSLRVVEGSTRPRLCSHQFFFYSVISRYLQSKKKKHLLNLSVCLWHSIMACALGQTFLKFDREELWDSKFS
jgi:hypothetical protein